MVEIEKALGLFDKQTRWQRLRANWIPLATIILAAIAVVIAYLAWLQPEWKRHADDDLGSKIDRQIDAKLVSPLAQISDQGKSLARIEGRLGEISDLLKIVTQSEMKRVSELPPQEFKSKLREVMAVFAVAKSVGTPPQPTVLKDIRAKLLDADHNAANFWPATAKFISYRSMDVSLRKAPDSLSLPRCTDTEPMPYKVTAVGRQGAIKTFTNPYYENWVCT